MLNMQSVDAIESLEEELADLNEKVAEAQATLREKFGLTVMPKEQDRVDGTRIYPDFFCPCLLEY